MALFAGSTYDVITKFLPDAVDEYFVEDSKTVILENGAKFIDVSFNEAGYVKIADFLLDGLSDYYKTQVEPRPGNPAGYAAYAGNLGSGERDGFDIGGTDVKWEIFKLQWCRGRQFRIDHIANEETGKVVTGGIIEKFHREKVIPEVDACRFSVIADAASATLGNLSVDVLTGGGATLTSENILSRFFALRKELVQNEVPLDELVWFVCPDIYEMIVNSKELTRYITQEDYRTEKGLEFKVAALNGTPIIEVPQSRFFTNVMTTRNGFQAGAGSKPINYLMCSRKAIVPIRKIEHQKMYGEEMAGVAGFYGTMMNYLLYHGVVIPKNKVLAIQLSVGEASATTVTNVLLVDLREGDSSGTTLFKAHYTRPSAMRGTVVYAAGTGDNDDENPFTVGQTVSDIDGGQAGDPVSIEDGKQFTTAESKLYFALVDYRGVCIATSKFITIPKKA